MSTCFFVSDLHGRVDRYEKLIKKIEEEPPAAVFMGGDLLPSDLFRRTGNKKTYDSFLNEFLVPGFGELKSKLSQHYPRVFLILGNDDGKFEESEVIKAEEQGIWEYIHNRKIAFNDFSVYGYAYVPPTPFQLKDWERYDVSRYTDPGCISPEEGWHTYDSPKNIIKYATIQKDLETLVGNDDLSKAIFLFHTPPYQTKLDRAALDGKYIDYVPLDVHVGSIAVKRFIEERQPLITLHGHVHESAKITGSWQDLIGNTQAYSAAHAGPELALIRFNPHDPDISLRELV
jgi:Icc-related predicted phosphoesterase